MIFLQRRGGQRREKGDQNCPSANQKNPIIILNQRRRDTKSRCRAGLDQNNYCIISSSDEPGIDLALICMRNRREEDVPIRLPNRYKCPKEED